ncbi:MAG TPA: ABC transporter permease subunit [Thermoanaerobaculia bacterium]
MAGLLLPAATFIVASFVENDETGGGLSLDALNDLTIANYSDVASTLANGDAHDPVRKLFRYFGNTAIVAVCTVAVAVVIGLMGAYVATRSNFRWANVIRHVGLWAYVIPPIVLVFPYGHLLSKVRLQGSLIGLLLAHIAFCTPLALWLMMQYMESIPRHWDRAAEADGLSCLAALWYVLLPRVRTGVAAVATFVATLSWNDVVLAYVLADDRSKTLGIGIQEAFPNETLSSNSTAAAAILVASVPLVGAVVATYAYVIAHTRREWGLSS